MKIKISVDSFIGEINNFIFKKKTIQNVYTLLIWKKNVFNNHCNYFIETFCIKIINGSSSMYDEVFVCSFQ